MNPTVSIFKSFATKGEPVPILEILAQIQGGKWAAKIAKLRNEKDPVQAKKLKRGLPVFTPSCETDGTHQAIGAIAHSGFICADVDKIGMEPARTLRDKIKGYPSAFAAWLSPSGDGLKVLIRVPVDIPRHAESFLAVQKLFRETFGVDIDKSCRDIARLCFVSHDPDLWINSDATEIELEEQPSREYLLKKRSETSTTQTTNSSVSVPVSESVSKSVSISMPKGAKEDKPHQFPTAELAKLFHSLVRSRAGNVHSGTRNAHIVEMVPFLYSAVSEYVVRLFVKEFHREHEDVFNDPLSQTMAEAESLLRGVAASYVAALPPESLKKYQALDDAEKPAFRICKALAQLDNEEMPLGEFFISCANLAVRLNTASSTAHNMLKSFARLGILNMLAKGQSYRTGPVAEGQKRKATVFRFLLP